MHRSTKIIPSHNIKIAHHLPFVCDSKQAFLANVSNKQAFINMVSDALNHEQRMKVLHDKGDADLLIATIAIDCAVDHHTQIICEDADIFQLLVIKVKPNSKTLYMVTDKPNANNP